MPLETKLLNYGISARMSQMPRPDPEVPRAQAVDPETGELAFDPVFELIFVEQATGSAYVIPLNERGIEILQQTLAMANFSPVVVAKKPGIIVPGR